MGEFLRRFWIPALTSSDLPAPDCDPVELRLLGEDLVAFRDTSGQVGVLQARCPHRQAPLFYRRNEACGLRARTGGKGEFRTPITRTDFQYGFRYPLIIH